MSGREYSSRGHGIELIQFSFVVLPITNLFHLSLLFGYDPLINNKNNFGLLKVSFIILIIANFMVGYNLYDQARFGIGPGFIAAFPIIFVLGINDLIAILLYIFTQHPRGIAKVVLYAVLIPLSIGSIWIPGSYVSKSSSKVPNNALPRRLAL